MRSSEPFWEERVLIAVSIYRQLRARVCVLFLPLLHLGPIVPPPLCLSHEHVMVWLMLEEPSQFLDAFSPLRRAFKRRSPRLVEGVNNPRTTCCLYNALVV